MILSKRPVKQAVFLNAHFYESIISANLFIDFYVYNCLLALKFILTCLWFLGDRLIIYPKFPFCVLRPRRRFRYRAKLFAVSP